MANFDEPGKVDLINFMERNYMFNMPLEKLGYLSGRSLSTFNRDFKKFVQLGFVFDVHTREYTNFYFVIPIRPRRREDPVLIAIARGSSPSISLCDFNLAPRFETNNALNRVYCVGRDDR